jgi:hypothetical protein
MASWRETLFGRRAFERRYEIINYVAETRGFQRYLEIGTSNGRCLEKVRCAYKVGVDPNPRCTPTDWTLHAKPSDEFFAGNSETFDLVFIDGLHLAEQVVRDIFHSLEVLEPGGVVLLHDCDPQTEDAASREPVELGGDASWNGDVWKAIAYVRAHHPELYCQVIRRDQGIGVLFPKEDRAIRLTPEIESQAGAFIAPLGWSDLERDRAALLGSIRTARELEAQLRRHGR